VQSRRGDLLTAIKQRAIDTATVVRERIYLTWTGEPRSYDLTVIPTLDPGGKARGITCIGADVTARLAWLKAAGAAGKASAAVSPSGLWLLKGLKAIFKPSVQEPEPAPILVAHGDLVIDEALHGLRGPEGEVRLTRTEWLLLKRFLEERGRVIPRETLLSRIWGPLYRTEASLLHDAVSRLRQRFHAAGLDPDLIETVHGVGYRLLGQ